MLQARGSVLLEMFTFITNIAKNSVLALGDTMKLGKLFWIEVHCTIESCKVS